MLSCEHLTESTTINMCKRTCRECGARAYVSKGWCANRECERALVSGFRAREQTRAREQGQEALY